MDLLGALRSVTDGSKLGAALKVVSAFSKVEQLIADIKNLAPDVHQALTASIADITSIFGQIGEPIDPSTNSSEQGLNLLVPYGGRKTSMDLLCCHITRVLWNRGVGYGLVYYRYLLSR